MYKVNGYEKGRMHEAPSMHKGIAYYPTFDGARFIKDRRVPSGRIVEYERGFAIQYWVSGPYYPEHEFGVDLV